MLRAASRAQIFRRLEISTDVSYAFLGMAKLFATLFSWSHLQARHLPTSPRSHPISPFHDLRSHLQARHLPTSPRSPPIPSDLPLPRPSLTVHRFSWSHLQACLWGLLPQLSGETYNWIVALRRSHADCALYADSCDVPLAPWDVYSAAFYWSVMTLSSVGYGEMLPVTTVERTCCSVLMLFSSMLWCAAISHELP